jgi:outer membrane receptor protein involved in Fe transport
VQNQAVNSAFGDASFTWNGWWTVEGTARNDWSSTLPQANNSYFYPSVNTSIVLSDAIPSIKNSVISYLKLRGGTARVGNDAPPYSLFTTFSGNANQFGGLPLYSLGNTLQNPNLKPEQTTSNEAGLELGLFNNRVSLDASVYKKSTKDEITTVTIPSSSGFSSQLLNAGQIDNKGFEALLNFEPIRTGRWDWNSTINFSHNRGTVVSLAPGLESIRLGNFRFTEVDAIPGQPYGTIRGFGIKRDASGVPLLDNIGEWESTDTLVTLGNIQPDWIAGWVNTVHYKNFTLGATLDVRHGGKLFSGTNFFGTATGTLASTLKGREVDWNNPGIVINGYIESTCDANGANCQKNTKTITSEQYFQSIAYNEIGEPYVYDDSFVKLREIRLGYDLPPRLASRLSATAVNIAFVGRNVFTHSNVPNVDPEVTYGTGNSNGLEYAELPVPRSFGFNVRITP